MLSNRGNSIIEVIVVIVILSLGIIGAYGILDSGQKLANTSENRIKAINIAREGIEAVQNIRDTNWAKFTSDPTHCWNSYNYDPACIGNPGKGIGTGSYFLIQSGALWTLSGVASPSTTYTGALTKFPVSYDADGLIIQTGSTTRCNAYTSTGCLTIFTREITISYTGASADPDTSDKMEVHSIVKWVDNSKEGVYTIDLKSILTNWKKGF